MGDASSPSALHCATAAHVVYKFRHEPYGRDFSRVVYADAAAEKQQVDQQPLHDHEPAAFDGYDDAQYFYDQQAEFDTTAVGYPLPDDSHWSAEVPPECLDASFDAGFAEHPFARCFVEPVRVPLPTWVPGDDTAHFRGHNAAGRPLSAVRLFLGQLPFEASRGFVERLLQALVPETRLFAFDPVRRAVECQRGAVVKQLRSGAAFVVVEEGVACALLDAFAEIKCLVDGECLWLAAGSAQSALERHCYWLRQRAARRPMGLPYSPVTLEVARSVQKRSRRQHVAEAGLYY